MSAEKFSYNPYSEAIYERDRTGLSSSYLTALYGTDITQFEGVAVEITTAVMENPKQQVAAVTITALIDEHPHPWMCGELLSIAWCWKLELQNGEVLGFTNHDEDISFDGVTYEAATGFDPSVVDSTDDMAVDNLDVEGVLSSDRIAEEDIASGVYDFAVMTIYLVDWMNPDWTHRIIRKGTIGKITHRKIGLTAEVRGMMEAYQYSGGEVYQKLCRARLGDEKCGLNRANYTVDGIVTQVANRSSFSTNVAAETNYYTYGVLTFTTGKNKGTKLEIQSQTADGRIVLYLPAPHNPEIGDAFTITAGCDGNYTTCILKFDNRLNFRGEPWVPGTDYLVSYPIRGTNTVTSSQNAKRGDGAHVSDGKTYG